MLTVRRLQEAPAVAPRSSSHGGQLRTLTARMLNEARGDIGRRRVQICFETQTQDKSGH